MFHHFNLITLIVVSYLYQEYFLTLMSRCFAMCLVAGWVVGGVGRMAGEGMVGLVGLAGLFCDSN